MSQPFPSANGNSEASVPQTFASTSKYQPRHGNLRQPYVYRIGRSNDIAIYVPPELVSVAKNYWSQALFYNGLVEDPSLLAKKTWVRL